MAAASLNDEILLICLSPVMAVQPLPAADDGGRLPDRP
jgi:hypothetical protein